MVSRRKPPQGVIAVTGTTYTPSTPLLYDTYFWRVRVLGGGDSGWSNTWKVTIAAPQITAPERNLFTTSTPTLHWSPVTWAVRYEIEISSDPYFRVRVAYYLRDEVGGNVLEYFIPSGEKALKDGVYYWHVRAKNALGVWGRWSATDRFVVDVPQRKQQRATEKCVALYDLSDSSLGFRRLPPHWTRSVT